MQQSAVFQQWQRSCYVFPAWRKHKSSLSKYQASLDTIDQQNGSLRNINMEGQRLFIRAEVASEGVKNKVGMLLSH